jgi:hypothetical protein
MESSSSQRDKTFPTSSRRLAALTARGPTPGRACAPVSAPLQPDRRPCREYSNQPPEKGYVVAGTVGSTALATSPVRVPHRARPGGHSCSLRSGPKPARVANQRTAP